MNTVAPAEKLNPEAGAGLRSLTTGILLLPIVVAGVFLNAFIILLFWNWFVVPPA